jgi:hypothetical protein
MVISPHRSAFHLLLLALLLPLSLGAQGGATGRIAGRIFNPATQEYVRNAEVSVEGTNLVVFSRTCPPGRPRSRWPTLVTTAPRPA